MTSQVDIFPLNGDMGTIRGFKVLCMCLGTLDIIMGGNLGLIPRNMLLRNLEPRMMC